MKCGKCGYDDLGTGSAHVCRSGAPQPNEFLKKMADDSFASLWLSYCDQKEAISEQSEAIDRLRKVARQALEALLPHKSTALRWYTPEDAAIDALRKELGDV